MSIFPNWQDYAVHQRQKETGCIPTGYEMLLRAAGVEGVDYTTFQDEFNLDIGKIQGRDVFENNFVSVATAIQEKYTILKFAYKKFKQGEGCKKLNAIEELLKNGRFVLISLSNIIFGGTGWHIMLIVDADEELLHLLLMVDKDGNPDVRPIKKADFVHIHDNYDGGNDIAYLETW